MTDLEELKKEIEQRLHIEKERYIEKVDDDLAPEIMLTRKFIIKYSRQSKVWLLHYRQKLVSKCIFEVLYERHKMYKSYRKRRIAMTPLLQHTIIKYNNQISKWERQGLDYMEIHQKSFLKNGKPYYITYHRSELITNTIYKLLPLFFRNSLFYSEKYRYSTMYLALNKLGLKVCRIWFEDTHIDFINPIKQDKSGWTVQL